MSFTPFKRNIRENIPAPLIGVMLSLKYFRKQLPGHEVFVSAVKNKNGIEIGGPSRLFQTILPIYRAARSLDGVNFSNNTVWEGDIESGENYNYYFSKKGFQFISDATNLSAIDSKAYDFVLSSNCLEHIANPLKALIEWKRVIKMGGAMILVLPNKESNFDHKRPITSFEHLIDDYNSDTTEHDLTHLDEIFALHDLSLDLPAGSLENFRERSLNNFNNRTLHHHVFDLDLIRNILDYSGFDIRTTSTTRTDLFALASRRN